MSNDFSEAAAKALERIASVLAALYADSMKDVTQGNKAERLSRLGFSNAQIADALGTTENTINVGRVKHRKKAKRNRSRASRQSTAKSKLK